MECNPDDINIKNIKGWKNNNINRISLGVQSFFDSDLELMNRSHNSSTATQAIELIKDNFIEKTPFKNSKFEESINDTQEEFDLKLTKWTDLIYEEAKKGPVVVYFHFVGHGFTFRTQSAQAAAMTFITHLDTIGQETCTNIELYLKDLSR